MKGIGYIGKIGDVMKFLELYCLVNGSKTIHETLIRRNVVSSVYRIKSSGFKRVDYGRR